jgi:hypothetical protein
MVIEQRESPAMISCFFFVASPNTRTVPVGLAMRQAMSPHTTESAITSRNPRPLCVFALRLSNEEKLWLTRCIQTQKAAK